MFFSAFDHSAIILYKVYIVPWLCFGVQFTCFILLRTEMCRRPVALLASPMDINLQNVTSPRKEPAWSLSPRGPPWPPTRRCWNRLPHLSPPANAPGHLRLWCWHDLSIFFTSSPSLWARRSQGAILASWQALDCYIIWCFVDLYRRLKQAEIMRNRWILLTGRERCCRLVASWVSSAKPRPSGTSGWCSSDLRDSL